MIKNIIEKNKKIDFTTEKINKLKELFPNCFTKNKEFDISAFAEELKPTQLITKENYGLNFLGKNYAKYIASLETETILVPDTKNNNTEENKNSENIYITGDNIDALKHLTNSYSNKIKCIYIDPQYNTGNDGFTYNDKFDLSIDKLTEILDINEEEAKRIYNMTNSKSNSHSAWLTFIYPRLYLARQLLKEDGVIFISIDDNEESNLKLLCDNIFGEENFIAKLIWTNNEGGGSSDSKFFKIKHEYILCYSKKIDSLSDIKNIDIIDKDRYKLKDEFVETRGKYQLVKLSSASLQYSKSLDYQLTAPDGTIIKPVDNTDKNRAIWRWSKTKYEWGIKNKFIEWKKDKKGIWQVYTKQYINCDNDGNIVERTKRPLGFINEYSSTQGSKEIFELFNGIKLFDYPKPTDLIEYLIDRFAYNKEDIILDFFSGSGTTAHAVMKLNAKDNGHRKYIMVQIPEKCDIKSEAYKNGYQTIDKIGQERIKRAAKKIKEETNAKIDYGFKHYTIKDINIKTIDKLEKFEPNFVLSDASILNEFGTNSVLTTWMNEDGYGLRDTYEELELEDYIAYKCQNTIYLLNWNITDLFIKSLIEKYEKEKFDCNRIVLFGYSFTLNDIQTLKDNLQQIKNIKGITVEVITRY